MLADTSCTRRRTKVGYVSRSSVPDLCSHWVVHPTAAALRRFAWKVTLAHRSCRREWARRQMLELGHAKTGDGNELNAGPEMPCSELELL
jgi:hypothetical protein